MVAKRPTPAANVRAVKATRIVMLLQSVVNMDVIQTPAVFVPHARRTRIAT